MSETTNSVTTAATQEAATTASQTVETPAANTAPETKTDNFLSGLTGETVETPVEKPVEQPEGTEGNTEKPASDKPEETTEPTDKPEDTENKTEPSKGEQRKQQLQDEIRELVAKRNKYREEVTRENAEIYKPATVEELVDGGMTEEDAQAEVDKQTGEVERYNTHVAELGHDLSFGAQQVFMDYPMFDPDNEGEYNKELAEPIAELYKSVAGISVDPNTGRVNGIQVMPQDFYQKIGPIIQIISKTAESKGQKAAQTMYAAVEAPTSAAPKEEKVDPFLAGLKG